MANPVVTFPRVAQAGRVAAVGRVARVGRVAAVGRLRLFFNYLMRDTYNDAHAGGAVNGTSADTGQARTVTDTNSKLSISGGLVRFATGGAAAGDPGIWYPSIARESGRVLIVEVTPADTSSDIRVGLDVNQSGTISECFRFLANLRIVTSAGNITLGWSFSAGVAYKIALVLRATGMFYFIKGGVFTTWTLLWDEVASVTNPLFPGASVASTTTVFTMDDFRSPNFLWLPSPQASDSFVRANGALGSTDGLATQEQNGGSGKVWTGATWAIVSNKAVNTPTEGANVITNGGFGSDTAWTKGTGFTIAGGVAVAAAGSQSDITEANGVVGTWYKCLFDVVTATAGGFTALLNTLVPFRSAPGTYTHTGRATTTAVGIRKNAAGAGTLDNVSFVPLTLSTLFASLQDLSGDVMASVEATILTATQAGLVLNLDSPSNPQNFIVAYHDGTNARLEKCVAGVYTQVISAAATYSAGAVLRVVKKGTSYALYYNGAAVGAVSTVSDTGVINNALHGMFSTNSGNSLANLVIRPTGSNNEYQQLDVA